MPVMYYQPLYTVKEASKVLKCSPGAVYELINTNKLPCLILGAKKIKGRDLEEFINNYPTEQREGGPEKTA